MKRLRFSAIVAMGIVALVLCSTGVIGAPIILNEYNAVRSDLLLGSGASSDAYFGAVTGNGGDWMEFVVIQDHLDVRGWRFATAQNGAADATIDIPDILDFSNLRSGTILTFAEDVATDLSYNPFAGDWWINFNASFSAGDATHNNFQVTILDSSLASVFGPVGEGVSPASGVGSSEVFKLETNPTEFIAPESIFYKDGSSSTFGHANVWSSGTFTQDFSGLRSAVVNTPEPTSLLGLALGVWPVAMRMRKSKK